MPQDAFTLRHICRELNMLFSGGKINKITQPSKDVVVFTVYTGKTTKRLLISADPSCSRIGVSSADEKMLDTPSFCLLLRKHLSGATIKNIELCGFDRIVKIDLTPSKEFFDSLDKVLYVELMGRYSNIILTENGKILGGNRGINTFDDTVRPLFTGQEYKFPPTNDKLNPEDYKLVDIFKDATDLEDAIFKNVQGVAKSTAEWVVREFIKDNNLTGFDVCAYVNSHVDEFFIYMNNRLYSDKSRPCVSVKDGLVEDFFVLPYGEEEYLFFDTLIDAEDYYFTQKIKDREIAKKRERANSLITSLIKKATKRLNAIIGKKKDAEGLEENRIKGELIIANIYKIKRGDKTLSCVNYYDGKEMEISLDENLSPSMNAEVYYKKYAKQKRTLDAIKPQLDGATKELEYYLSIQDEISLCESVSDYDLVLSEIKPEKTQKKKSKKEEPVGRVYVKDGFIVRVGRNNVENDKLVANAKKDSVWLHVKDYHSSHAIIEADGREIPDKIILFASEITAYFSKCRETGKVEVVYTRRKFVKKPTGAKPGFVVYDNFKSKVVCPNKHEEFIKAD